MVRDPQGQHAPPRALVVGGGANRAGGATLAGATQGMTTTRYIIFLLAIGAPFILILQMLLRLGMGPVALGAGTLILALLVIYRVELGIFIMAGLVFWQFQTRLSESFTLVKAVGIVVALFGAFAVLRTRGPKWPWVMKFAVAFALWSLVGSLYNISPPFQLSLLKPASVFSNILFMYLIMRACHTPATLRTLVIVIALSATGEAVLGLVSPYHAPAGGGATVARLATAEEMNINHYARILTPGIFLPFFLIGETRRKILWAGLLAAVLLCMVAQILTVSRGAIIGTAMGGVVLLLTLKHVGAGAKLGLLLVLVGLVTGAILLSGSFGAPEAWSVRMSESSLRSAAEHRLGLWQLAGSAIADNPIFGSGLGLESVEYFRRGLVATESHNDILSAGLNTGIPGMVCFIGVLAAGWVGLWRLPAGIGRSALLGMWTAIVVGGFFNPTLNRKYFWMPAGVCAAAMVLHHVRTRWASAAAGPPPVPAHMAQRALSRPGGPAAADQSAVGPATGQ